MSRDRLRAICALLSLASLVAVGTALWRPPVARAAPQSLALTPAGSAVTLRAYALGLMPIDGSFTQFRGRIDYDPTQPAQCKVELVAAAGSLLFSDPSMREEVLSPTFLDAAAFPSLIYRGECARSALQGDLALHGQTHPFTLALAGDRTHLTATGTINRTAWGVDGRALTVGSSIRIQVSVTLPEATRGTLPGLLIHATP